MSASAAVRPLRASGQGSARVLRSLAPLARRLARLEPLVYALWAAAWTLSSGRTFYGYMMKQTGGEWSAPLDDVFIHFDYARATAQGHPFEWVVGNGYSSGNTSISYPFVLAAGYLAGFQRERLMLWAALVAALSVFAVLLAGRKLFTGLARRDATDESVGDRAASYLLPPMFLALGALDWTLWSGMEVAFLLATWAAGLVAYLALVETPPDALAAARRRALWLGAAGALMVLTRPEAVSTLGAFGLSALWARRRGLGLGGAVGLCMRMFAPGALVVVGLAVTNRLLTGEWSANGAIVKLAVYNPFMSREAKWEDYAFNFKYEIFRNIEYHFTDVAALGCILPALALAALAFRKTRPLALVLWAQIVGWALLVAFNGQVRWQNERYTMPAVAWLVIAAALGVSALVRRAGRPHVVVSVLVGVLIVQAVIAAKAPDARPSLAVSWGLSLACGAAVFLLLWLRPARALAVVAALATFHLHQALEDAGPEVVLRPRVPQHSRSAHRDRGGGSARCGRDACSWATPARSCTRPVGPGSTSSGSAATTLSRSRAPASRASPRPSSSWSTSPRKTCPISSPSTRAGGASCRRGSVAGSRSGPPRRGTSSAAATRTSSTWPTGTCSGRERRPAPSRPVAPSSTPWTSPTS